jgi:hypothetical protein
MDTEEQKTDPNATPPGGVSPTGGGGGAVRLSPQSATAPVGGTGTNSGTPGSAPQPAGAGGSFASLNKYIDANQGQAAPLAGQITSGINQQYGNLDAANNAAIAGINSQVANAPGYTASNPNTLTQEAANPVSFSSDPNNVKQFQSLLNNTYSGPASAEGTSNYTNQQGAINNAIAAGTANTTTEAGRKNLLVQNEAAPTTGVTALNSAILSQDPNALGSIENAYQPFNNLLTNLNTGAQATDATISKEQADATTSSAAANKQIADQLSGLNTQIQGDNTNAFNAANTNFQNLAGSFSNMATPNQALVAGLNKDYTTGGAGNNNAANQAAAKADLSRMSLSSLTPAQLSQLGLTSDQVNQLNQAQSQLLMPAFQASGNPGNGSAYTQSTEAPLSNWFSGAAPTQANFAGATPDEIAKGNALNQLSGTNGFVAPTAGPAYVAPTFNFQGALDALTQANAQNKTQTQAMADQVAANQQAAYVASQNQGPLSQLNNFGNQFLPKSSQGPQVGVGNF